MVGVNPKEKKSNSVGKNARQCREGSGCPRGSMTDMWWPVHGADHFMVCGQCSHVKLDMQKETGNGSSDKEEEKASQYTVAPHGSVQ